MDTGPALPDNADASLRLPDAPDPISLADLVLRMGLQIKSCCWLQRAHPVPRAVGARRGGWGGGRQTLGSCLATSGTLIIRQAHPPVDSSLVNFHSSCGNRTGGWPSRLETLLRPWKEHESLLGRWQGGVWRPELALGLPLTSCVVLLHLTDPSEPRFLICITG